MPSNNSVRPSLRPSRRSSHSSRRFVVTADMTPEDYYKLVHSYYIPSEPVQGFVPGGANHQPQTRSKLSQVVNADDLPSPTSPPHDATRRESDAALPNQRPPRLRRTPTKDANRNQAAMTLVNKVDHYSGACEQHLEYSSDGVVVVRAADPMVRREGNVCELVMAALQRDGIAYGTPDHVRRSTSNEARRPSVPRSASQSYTNENIHNNHDNTTNLSRSGRVQKRQMRHSDAEAPNAYTRRPSKNDDPHASLSRSHSTGVPPLKRGGKFYEELDSDAELRRPRAQGRGYSVDSVFSKASKAYVPVPQRRRAASDAHTCMSYMAEAPHDIPTTPASLPPNPLYNIYRCNGVQINYYDSNTRGPHCPLVPSAKPIRGILKRTQSAKFQAKPGDLADLGVGRRRSVMSDPYAYDLVFGEGDGAGKGEKRKGREESKRGKRVEKRGKKERKGKERKGKDKKEELGWLKGLRPSWIVA